MIVEFSRQELTFLLTLLQSDRQTALQLLAAEHAYKPSLLPKLENAYKALKRNEAESD
jgi:hypothetical protein